MQYPLTEIYFYLTHGCNLRCRHCWIAPTFQQSKERESSLSLERFVSIIKQAKPLGLRTIKLTGGEPLLHPDFEKILKIIFEENLELSLETNGTLLSQSIADMIAKAKNCFVAISLDGAKPRTHDLIRGIKGSFEKTIQGIFYLTQRGIKPQLIMSIMDTNYQEVDEMVSLAEKLGVGSIKFNLIQPSARGKILHEKGLCLSIAELIDLGHHIENVLATKTFLRLFFDYPIVFRSKAEIFHQMNFTGCEILQVLGVLANGSYALCGIGENIPELLFGHVDQDSLEKIWQTHPILLELRSGLPKNIRGICKNCSLNFLCKGNCIAQNYNRSRDLWAPFWFCEEAYQKNLFPTRFLVSKS